MSLRVERFCLVFLMLFTIPLYAAPADKTPVTLFADVLYWELREGSDENWGQYITPKGSYQSATLYDAPFKWDPGFRFGFVYTAPSGVWDTSLYYTHFQTDASDSASGHIYSAYLGNFFANNTNGKNFGPFYDSGKVKWNYRFQTLDFEVGRYFNVDRRLTLRPFAGIKSAIIRQDIDTNWYGPKTTNSSGVIIPITTFTHATEKVENNFWGIGPSLGLDTLWPLAESKRQSFSMLANLSGALMWGHWSFSDHYKNNTPVSIDIKTSDIIDAATMVRGVFGFEWFRQYAKTELTLQFTYEAQVWFDQLQYYNYNMGRLNNLMSLQGGALSIRYNY